MYSNMIHVQLNEVYQTLVSVDILTIIVRQESFGDVVDRIHEGYNVKLLFYRLGRCPLPQ